MIYYLDLFSLRGGGGVGVLRHLFNPSGMLMCPSTHLMSSLDRKMKCTYVGQFLRQDLPSPVHQLINHFTDLVQVYSSCLKQKQKNKTHCRFRL